MDNKDSERPRAVRLSRSDEKKLTSAIAEEVEKYLKEHPGQTWLDNDLIQFDFLAPKDSEKPPEK
jgi:hypothetical protein